jgi:hypothetical protein
MFFLNLECHFAIIIDCSSTIKLKYNSETEAHYVQKSINFNGHNIGFFGL